MKSENQFNLRRIVGSNKKDLNGLNNILLQWSDSRYQMNRDYFKSLTEESYVLGIFDEEHLAGTVTLIKTYKLSGIKGTIEHLIVDEQYRGRGLGKQLMGFAIDAAKKEKIDTLFLICEPYRKEANSLYEKIGFKIKETNFYYLNLI